MAQKKKRSLSLDRKKTCLTSQCQASTCMDSEWMEKSCQEGCFEGSRSEKSVNNDSSSCARAKRKEGGSPVHAAHRKNTVVWTETQSGLCFSLANQRFMLHEKPPIGRPCCVIHRRGFPSYFFSVSFFFSRKILFLQCMLCDACGLGNTFYFTFTFVASKSACFMSQTHDAWFFRII